MCSHKPSSSCLYLQSTDHHNPRPTHAPSTFPKRHVFQPEASLSSRLSSLPLLPWHPQKDQGGGVPRLHSPAWANRYLMKHCAGWQHSAFISSPLGLPAGRALLLQNLLASTPVPARTLSHSPNETPVWERILRATHRGRKKRQLPRPPWCSSYPGSRTDLVQASSAGLVQSLAKVLHYLDAPTLQLSPWKPDKKAASHAATCHSGMAACPRYFTQRQMRNRHLMCSRLYQVLVYLSGWVWAKNLLQGLLESPRSSFMTEMWSWWSCSPPHLPGLHNAMKGLMLWLQSSNITLWNYTDLQ